ncbi:AAA family ATPase [Umezawaea sp. Da 62-37]|uniref:ATP-binding protein n=1 Tax=Umezawaea sp. Da 62-37 TaxID=3075927 RepID=UPI0028F7448A|nr:AAA family ATPase [Umezawaea sp. Da 62-37]WNV89371.1 AAA family ATPase [Umezawaea sp. Da 62-37]
MASFVGREPELAVLFAAVDRVPAGGVVAVLVSGEAGIGKSSLLAEAGRRLRDRGAAVVIAEPDDLDRRIPYAALTGALRALGPLPGGLEPTRRAALAAMDLTEPSTFGRSCELMARLLTGLTADRAAVLVLDDLDQVDDDSLALLAVVLRRLSEAPLALIAAARSHGRSELADRLERHTEVCRVELAPLSDSDIGRVVEAVLDSPVDEALAVEVRKRADGNPFFATEIARSLRELDFLAVDGDRARLAVRPEAIRLTRADALLRRVAPLEPDARAVARAMSILRLVRLDQIGLLAGVAGLPEATVATAFDDLLRAGVVQRDDDRGYRFSHALVAEALYQEVGPASRGRLHGLVGARLLEDRERGLPVDLMRLAWHLAESAAPGDEVAVRVLVEAVALARTTAPETAASLCERALRLVPAGSPRHAELLALLCRVLARASRPAAAIEPGLAALAALPRGRDRARVSTALLTSLFSVGRLDEALRIADDEIRAGEVPPALLAQRALLLVFTGRYDDAIAESERIEALPGFAPAEGVVVFEQLAMVASMLFQHEKTVEYANRALRAADQPGLELQALAVCASTAALSGLVHDATWRLRRAEELVGDDGSAFLGELQVTRVALDWLGGRWDACVDRLGRATAELGTRQELMTLEGVRAIELEIRTWRGELDIGARLAAMAPPTTPTMSRLYAMALAGYLAARGDVEGARHVVTTAVDALGKAAYSCVLLGRMIEIDLARGDVARGERGMEQFRDAFELRGAPWTRTTFLRVTGLVERDAEVVRAAVEEAGTGGLEFEKARGQLVLGGLDPDAVPELVEAYRTFQRLGVHGLRRQAGARLRELGAKVPRGRVKAPGVLTEAEERVARLVQQGMRNRDIAAALHYSPRTVEVYLSRVFGKLRVSSRLELARVLDADGSGR